MALYPDGDKLDDFGQKFVLVNLAARRASQMTRDKAPALVETIADHPLTIAMEEIAAGAVIPTYEKVERITEDQETLESLEKAVGRGDNIDSLITELFRDSESLGGQAEEDVAFGEMGNEVIAAGGSLEDEAISLEGLADAEPVDDSLGTDDLD
jgi:DNA-directed RNA polymerase omega subunit